MTDFRTPFPSLEPLLFDKSAPHTVFGPDQSYKFDEDGFRKGTEIAIMQARQEMQEKIRSINDDIVSIGHPSDFNVTIDGVPIDKTRR